MGQAEIVAEAQALLLSSGDSAYLNQVYPEVLRDLGRQSGVFIHPEVISGQAGVSTYTVDDDAFEILKVLYYPDELDETPVGVLDIVSETWREQETRPAYWTKDLHNARTFRVVPSPLVNGVQGPLDIIDVIVGFSVPTDSLVAFTRRTPQASDLSQWLEGIIAYEVASREYARLGEGAHPTMADALHQLALLASTLSLPPGAMMQVQAG